MIERFINISFNSALMTASKSVKATEAKAASPEEELPTDPIEFARKLKQLVSEDFARSYRPIKRIALKH